MPEVSAVEYDFNLETFVAFCTDGEMYVLESTDLREAEIEAERIAEQLSFASFMPR